MPLVQYFLGVGGALLCLMFVLDVYVPKAPLREHHELDRSTIRITSRPSDAIVIDRFPPVHGSVAAGSGDAVRQALAMMPDGEAKQADVVATREDRPIAATPRKRRVAQRPQTRLAIGEIPSPVRSQSRSGNDWSQGSSSNWSSNWSQGWSQNRWANNQWTAW
jgi:hypothetical protein